MLVLDDFHEVADLGGDGRPRRAGRAPRRRRCGWSSSAAATRRCGSCGSASPGGLAELRARDLAFTDAEARAFLREAAVPRLSRRRRRRAAPARPRAGPAGLRLAVLTLRDHADPAAFVADFTGGDAAVTDYLLTEVLERQSECEAALPAADLARRRRVRRARRRARRATTTARATCSGWPGENAMLEPVDGRPGWFRFHPLLRDLLRAELHAHHGDELTRAAPRRRRAWLAEAGMVRAGHPPRAGRPATSRWSAASWRAAGSSCCLDGGLVMLRALVEMLPRGRGRRAARARARRAPPCTSRTASSSAATARCSGARWPAPTGCRRSAGVQFRVAYGVVGAPARAAARRRRPTGWPPRGGCIGDEVPAVAAPGLRALRAGEPRRGRAVGRRARRAPCRTSRRRWAARSWAATRTSPRSRSAHLALADALRTAASARAERRARDGHRDHPAARLDRHLRRRGRVRRRSARDRVPPRRPRRPPSARSSSRRRARSRAPATAARADRRSTARA